MNQIHLDIFKTKGVLAPCKCGSAFEIIASTGEDKKPIYSVACMRCATVYKAGKTILEAADNYMFDHL